MRLAYFVSHPIQYQAPLLRRLAAHPAIDLKVFFLSDFSAGNHRDPGFGVTFDWDTPLLEGYEYEFLGRSTAARTHSFFHPLVFGTRRVLISTPWDAAMFHGYAHHALMHGIVSAVSAGIPMFFRSESSLICTSRGAVKDKWVRWLVQHATALLWIGRENQDYYRSYGARDEQLFFVPYTVDNDFFRRRATDASTAVGALRAELRLTQDRPVILYAGKLMGRKNPVLLLEAFARLPADSSSHRPYLVYVGDGEERPAVIRRTAELGIQEDVRLVGFKNQTELPRYFALCDLFVMPSSREPFGLIVNEVMNAGKAVISTDEVGASRDLVVEGRNGFVVRAGNREALTLAMQRALADREQLDCMGHESARIIERWNHDRCVEGILQALNAAKRGLAKHGAS